MAFSFGATPTTAAAPSAGGFSFGGGSTPAPASTGFTAAPPTGGGLFGSAPATANSNAPLTSGVGFGGPSSTASAPAAPATNGFSFGSPAGAGPAANTNANAGSSLFGSSSSSSFTPGASLFGSTTTTTPTMNSGQPANSSFGQNQPSQSHANGQFNQNQQITATTPFKSLPPNAQTLIDGIHNLIHQHNQTMSSVSTMIPALLANDGNTDADKAAGPGTGTEIATHNGHSSRMAPLSQRMQATQNKVTELKGDLEDTSISVSKVFGESNELYKVTHECAIYPVKNIAARRQIDLPFDKPNADAQANQLSDTVKRLNAMLQENAMHVDRLEGMPSVYLWRMMDDLQKRIEGLYQKLGVMKKELGGRSQMVWREVERITGGGGGVRNMDATEELSSAVQNQMHALVRVAGIVGRLNEMMEELRQAYKRQVAFERFQKGGMSSMNGNGQMNMGGMGSGAGVGIGSDNGMGFDPFLEADRKEDEEERRLNLEVRKRTIQAAANIPIMNALPAAPLTPAPASGGLFGNTPATAPVANGGFFGSTPTPAPSGGLFGARSPAPAASAFGSFGSPVPAAPAAAGGGLFGGTAAPAPAGGGMFGASTPALAPAGGAFSFGGGGNTPAPAPVTGGLFGAPAAAPVGGGLFGGAAPAAPAASKSRRRAGRRR